SRSGIRLFPLRSLKTRPHGLHRRVETIRQGGPSVCRPECRKRRSITRMHPGLLAQPLYKPLDNASREPRHPPKTRTPPQTRRIPICLKNAGRGGSKRVPEERKSAIIPPVQQQKKSRVMPPPPHPLPR